MFDMTYHVLHILPLVHVLSFITSNSQQHQHPNYALLFTELLKTSRPLILFPLQAFVHAITFLNHYRYLPGLLIPTSLSPLISSLLPENLQDQPNVDNKCFMCSYSILHIPIKEEIIFYISHNSVRFVNMNACGCMYVC